eukprot:Hpha_TRINITY_DN16374_c3_g2::TRINITY_DN16374_c3_g2_i2::g.61961::m.61961
MALAGLYRRRCEELKLKPNANLLAALPSEGSELVKLDLSDNLVGGAGLKALLEVIRHAPNLQHLRLKANNLTSPAAKDLAETLKSSSKLSLLDVRSNDIRLAGAELLDLVKANRRIEEMLLEDTFIRPFFSRRISAQLQKNLASAEQRKQSQGCLKDSSRPSTAEKKQVGFGEVVVSQPQPVKSPATTASPKSATGEGPNAEVIPAELRRYSAFEAADEDSPSPAASPAFGDFKSGFKAEPQITEEQEGLMKKLDSFSFAQGSPTKPGEEVRLAQQKRVVTEDERRALKSRQQNSPGDARFEEGPVEERPEHQAAKKAAAVTEKLSKPVRELKVSATEEVEREEVSKPPDATPNQPPLDPAGSGADARSGQGLS